MNNKIESIKTTTCTGCSACFNVCPADAIEFKRDEKGFYKPYVNYDKCIHCKKCDRTCPILNPSKKDSFKEKLYAAWADVKVRLSSSSGGAFTVLAKKILREGGVVFGAAWGDDFAVIHKACDSEVGLAELQKSKYVQSFVGLSFRKAEEYLNAGKKVLFVGTPCQIGGLKKYIENKRTDDKNLYTVDLFCYMVPPYDLFRRYLNDNFGPDLEKFEFRTKDKNLYVSHFFTYKKKNQKPKTVHDMVPWFKAYFQKMYECNACEQCIYQNENRIGDLSLGDFWGIENHDTTWNDGKGTSMIQMNSEKGRELLSSTQADFARIQEVPLNWIRDGQTNGKKAHPNQKLFYELLDGCHFNTAVHFGLAGKRFDIGFACVQVYKNYGSALTNFAMYKTLKDYGKSVLLINQPLSSKISPTHSKNFVIWPYPVEECARYYEDKQDMRKLNAICDKFLVGSDQVFNYEIYKQIDGFTKLDWVDDSHNKYSYSTSFGLNQILGSVEEREDFGNNLRRFKAVSVRETPAEKLVKDNFGVTATSVVDPVFLCDKSHYIKMLSPFEKYAAKRSVFCYILDPDTSKQQVIETVCKLKKKKHFAVSDMWRSKDNIKSLWSLDTYTGIPNETWLANIYYSDFVVTDSFHGLCFSLIFNKPFVVLPNKMRGNDRFTSILNLLGIPERLLPNDASPNLIASLLNKDIDYASVNEKLNREIIFSKVWLERYILNDK